ncbi:MAG: hypothetical protein ACKVPX_09490 [Myxococcaceae bacterium]
MFSPPLASGDRIAPSAATPAEQARGPLILTKNVYGMAPYDPKRVRDYQRELVSAGVLDIPRDTTIASIEFADGSRETARGVTAAWTAGERDNRAKLSLVERVLQVLAENKPEVMTTAVQRWLSRNPWTLVCRSPSGDILGGTLTSLVAASDWTELSPTAVLMSKQESSDTDQPRLAMVNSWVGRGKPGAVALDAAHALAKTLTDRPEWGISIQHHWAYSTPRALYYYRAQALPETLTLEQHLENARATEALRRELETQGKSSRDIREALANLTWDFAANFHLQRSAERKGAIPNAYSPLRINPHSDRVQAALEQLAHEGMGEDPSEPTRRQHGLPPFDLAEERRAIGEGYALIWEYPL